MNLNRNLFEKEFTAQESVKREGQVFYKIYKVEDENEIRTWIEGAEYYQKGIATPETLSFVNIAKRLFVEITKTASKWYFLPSFMLMWVLPPKRHLLALQGILEGFNGVLDKVIGSYILKPKHMTESARELRIFIYNFLLAYGFEETVCTNTAKYISHFIEYDNAYRFRMQDLFTETSKGRLASSPIKEFKRLAILSQERDSAVVSLKFQRLIRLVALVLLTPRVRKAFKKALQLSTFENLQFDKCDEYWVSMRTDYDYFGEKPDVRSLRNTGKSMPTPIPIELWDNQQTK